MDTSLKYIKTPRFKSSEALAMILKQNRDLNKHYYAKLNANIPILSPETKNKLNFFDKTQSSIYNLSEQTVKSSQVSVKPIQVFL